MLKFVLADGKIKFATHKVEWQETQKQFDSETKKMVDAAKTMSQDCYSEEQKNSLVSVLAERNINPVITECDTPSADLLAKCKDVFFNAYSDAEQFVNTGIKPKSQIEILQETVDALVISDLEV